MGAGGVTHLSCMTPQSCPWIQPLAGGSEVSQGVHGCVGEGVTSVLHPTHALNGDQPGS